MYSDRAMTLSMLNAFRGPRPWIWASGYDYGQQNLKYSSTSEAGEESTLKMSFSIPPTHTHRPYMRRAEIFNIYKAPI